MMPRVVWFTQFKNRLLFFIVGPTSSRLWYATTGGTHSIS